MSNIRKPMNKNQKHPSCDENCQKFSYPGDMSQLQSSLPSSFFEKIKNAQPPPVPPRHPTSTSVHGSSRYAAMGMGYGAPYSMGFGSRVMPYSNYGFNGMGYGSRYPYAGGYYGDMNSHDNIFIRMAEESSRPAFQSIESLVSAFSSISMMLESTYHAVYSSYRAVLGVVDQVSRLRNHLAHVLSTLALLRTLQWLCQKALHLLGLRRMNPSAEAAWSAATATVTKADGAPYSSDPQTAWPIFMFMGLVFGAPWLIFRIFSKLALKKASEFWNPSDSEPLKGVAMFDFRATHPGEISIKQGQMFLIAPKNVQSKIPGWTMISPDARTMGLVPTNYIRRCIIKKKSSANASASSVPCELPVVNESGNPVAAADTLYESQFNPEKVENQEVGCREGLPCAPDEGLPFAEEGMPCNTNDDLPCNTNEDLP